MTPEAVKAVRDALHEASQKLTASGYVGPAYQTIDAALALLAAEQAKAPPSSMDEILHNQLDRPRLTPSPRPATAAGIIDYPEAGAEAKSPPDRERLYNELMEMVEDRRVMGRDRDWLIQAAAALRLCPVTAGEWQTWQADVEAMAGSIAMTASRDRADEETYQNVFSEAFNRIIRLRPLPPSPKEAGR